MPLSAGGFDRAYDFIVFVNDWKNARVLYAESFARRCAVGRA
jgi:hypothetical protein